MSDRPASTHQFHHAKEIRFGMARVIYSGPGWALPGGGTAMDEQEARDMAERMDRVMRENADNAATVIGWP